MEGAGGGTKAYLMIVLRRGCVCVGGGGGTVP